VEKGGNVGRGKVNGGGEVMWKGQNDGEKKGGGRMKQGGGRG